MARNFVQPGNVVTTEAPLGGVTVGSIVAIGSLFGIATGTAAEGEGFELFIGGVWDLKKVQSEAWNAGERVYLDAAAGSLTTASTGNLLVGVAVESTTTSATTGRVRLNDAF